MSRDHTPSRPPSEQPPSRGAPFEPDPRAIARLLAGDGRGGDGATEPALATPWDEPELSNAEQERVWNSAMAAAATRHSIVQAELHAAAPVVAELIALENEALIERVTSDPTCHTWPVVEGLLFHAWDIRFESMQRVLELSQAAHVIVKKLDVERYGEQRIRELEILVYAYLAKAQGRVVGAKEVQESLERERELLVESQEHGFVVDRLVEQVVLLSKATDLWERGDISACCSTLRKAGAETPTVVAGSRWLAFIAANTIAACFRWLADVENDPGLLSRAYDLDKKALELGADEATAAAIELSSAVVLLDLGRPREALIALDRLETKQDLPNTIRGTMVLNKSRALRDLGENDLAVRYVAEYFEQMPIATSQTSLATTQLAELLARSGDLPVASGLFQATQQLLRRFGISDDMGVVSDTSLKHASLLIAPTLIANTILGTTAARTESSVGSSSTPSTASEPACEQDSRATLEHALSGCQQCLESLRTWIYTGRQTSSTGRRPPVAEDRQLENAWERALSSFIDRDPS